MVPQSQNRSDRKDFWFNFLFNIFIFYVFVIQLVCFFFLLQDSVYFFITLPSIHPLVMYYVAVLATTPWI